MKRFKLCLLIFIFCILNSISAFCASDTTKLNTYIECPECGFQQSCSSIIKSQQAYTYTHNDSIYLNNSVKLKCPKCKELNFYNDWINKEEYTEEYNDYLKRKDPNYKPEYGGTDNIVVSLLDDFMNSILDGSYNTSEFANIATGVKDLSLNIENHNELSMFREAFSKIKILIRDLALGLVLISFLIYGIKTYVIWSSNPEENPIEIVIRFFVAIALIMCYEQIFNLVLDMVNDFINNVNMAFGTLTNVSIYNNVTRNAGDFIGTIIKFFLAFLYITEFFKAIMSSVKVGFSLMIMRFGFPLACLGIINSHGQTFSNYIQTIIKQLITIVIQIFVINIACQLYSRGSNSIIVCIMCVCLLDMTKDLGPLLNNIAVSTGSVPGHIPGLTMMGQKLISSGLNKYFKK